MSDGFGFFWSLSDYLFLYILKIRLKYLMNISFHRIKIIILEIFELRYLTDS